MIEILSIAGSTVLIIITIITTTAKLEHRITKVETNVNWIMKAINGNFKKEP